MTGTDTSVATMTDLAAIWGQPLRRHAQQALDHAIPSGSRLHSAIAQLIDGACQTEGFLITRVFALAAHGAAGGDVDASIPAAASSLIWWAGAEALDDLSDMGAAATTLWTGLNELELSHASILCLTVVPAAALSVAGWHAEVERAAQRELAVSSVAAAEGQLLDADRDDEALTWQRVMRAYAAKTGAAYGRDGAIAALLTTADATAVRHWRTLGKLTGILRQVRNDNAGESVLVDEDASNGTPTLLMAYALESAPPPDRVELLALRDAASRDPDARTALRMRLRSPAVVDGYTSRLMAIHNRVSELLAALAEPSPYRDALQAFFDSSLTYALPEQNELCEAA